MTTIHTPFTPTPPPIHHPPDATAHDHHHLVPWFSYRVNLPHHPLPRLSSRPHLTTRRLLIRPLLPTDLAQLHDLRRHPETQTHSTTRGRADTTLEETRHALARLQRPNAHWYFGAFLRATGELIGECGLPACNDAPRSGWPEAEVLVKPAFWRQGYGTEMLGAVLESWWALPRAVRRHQLLPVGGKEPGERVVEGVGFVWEEGNGAAGEFFGKVLGRRAEGGFVEFDRRVGREGGLVRWRGALVTNPHEAEG